jgi:hypothetical protein
MGRMYHWGMETADPSASLPPLRRKAHCRSLGCAPAARRGRRDAKVQMAVRTLALVIGMEKLQGLREPHRLTSVALIVRYLRMLGMCDEDRALGDLLPDADSCEGLEPGG